MLTFDSYQKELGKFLLQIQNNKSFDHDAMGRLEKIGRELAKLLKHQDMIPKVILREMRSAIKILRAEAPYMPSEQRVMLDLADRIEMTFDLILLGEDYEDRLPGVPRVI